MRPYRGRCSSLKRYIKAFIRISLYQPSWQLWFLTILQLVSLDLHQRWALRWPQGFLLNISRYYSWLVLSWGYVVCYFAVWFLLSSRFFDWLKMFSILELALTFVAVAAIGFDSQLLLGGGNDLVGSACLSISWRIALRWHRIRQDFTYHLLLWQWCSRGAYFCPCL